MSILLQLQATRSVGIRARSMFSACTARQRNFTHIPRSSTPDSADDERTESSDDIQIEQMMTTKRKSKKGQAPEPAKPYKVGI